jgi:hypothetical protein
MGAMPHVVLRLYSTSRASSRKRYAVGQGLFFFFPSACNFPLTMMLTIYNIYSNVLLYLQYYSTQPGVK